MDEHLPVKWNHAGFVLWLADFTKHGDFQVHACWHTDQISLVFKAKHYFIFWILSHMVDGSCKGGCFSTRVWWGIPDVPFPRPWYLSIFVMILWLNIFSGVFTTFISVWRRHQMCHFRHLHVPPSLWQFYDLILSLVFTTLPVDLALCCDVGAQGHTDPPPYVCPVMRCPRKRDPTPTSSRSIHLYKISHPHPRLALPRIFLLLWSSIRILAPQESLASCLQSGRLQAPGSTSPMTIYHRPFNTAMDCTKPSWGGGVHCMPLYFFIVIKI